MSAVKAGTTSWRDYRFRALDSAGAPVTTLTHSSGGAAAGYRRTGAERQSITLSTLTNVEDAYASGAMKHEGAGWYILHVPDAAIAAGVDEVGVDIAFTDVTIVNAPIRLLGYDPRTELTTAVLANLDAAVSSLPSAADVWSGITATAGNFIADHVLRRSWASAAASANGDTKSFRSLLGAAAKLVNRFAVVGTTATVYEADDTTPLGTQTATTDAAAEHVTELNTDG